MGYGIVGRNSRRFWEEVSMRKFCFCLFICFFLFACNSTSVDLTPPVVTKVKPILATAFVTPTTSATKTTTVTLVPKKTPDQPQQHIAGLRMFDVVNEGWIWIDDNDIHHFFHVTNGGKIWKEI